MERVDKLIFNVNNCSEFFNKSEKYKNLNDNLSDFKVNLLNCSEKIKTIENFAHEYDFDYDTPSNGYRSFVDIFLSATKKSFNLFQRLLKSREKILFRADFYTEYEVQ